MIGIKAKRYCYVCSPYRGNILKRIRNRRYARELTERAINAGFTPITPHLYITQVLNDKIPAERQQGMAAGLELLQLCQELWAYIPPGGLPSEGMQQEIRYALDRGIEVKFIYD